MALECALFNPGQAPALWRRGRAQGQEGRALHSACPGGRLLVGKRKAQGAVGQPAPPRQGIPQHSHPWLFNNVLI